MSSSQMSIIAELYIAKPLGPVAAKHGIQVHIAIHGCGTKKSEKNADRKRLRIRKVEYQIQDIFGKHCNIVAIR